MKNDKFCTSQDDFFFEDYKKGSVFLFKSFRIQESEVLEFAKRYDPQPFHIDHDAAKNGPYKGLIASGWHTCALVMRVLVDNYFSKNSSLGSPGIDELRWMIPVRPGDELVVRVTVIEAKNSRSKPDRGIVESYVEAINQEKKLVISFKSVNFILTKESFL